MILLEQSYTAACWPCEGHLEDVP